MAADTRNPQIAAVTDTAAMARLWPPLLLTLLLYVGFAWFYHSPLCGPRLNRELFLWPACLLQIGLYIWGYVQCRNQSEGSATLTILGFGAVILLAAWWIPPFHSTDVFGYINRGWQQIHYHLNPYAVVVEQIPGWQHDPMLTDHWVSNPSPYGFLFMGLTKLLCLLGGGDKTGTLLWFKSLNVLVHGLTAWLVFRIARRLGHPRPELSLYLYLLNPLILIHHIANGHNDIVMTLFVVLGFYAVLRKHAWALLPCLTAAVLIKYLPVILLPFALVYLIRMRLWRDLATGLVLSVLLTGLCGYPYLKDWEAIRFNQIQHNALVSHSSLHHFLYSLFKQIANALPGLLPYKLLVRQQLKNLLLLGYGVIYGGMLYSFWLFFRPALPTLSSAVARLARLSGWVMVLLVCGVSLKFYPWYVGMVLALGFFLPPGNWLRRAVVLLSIAQVFALTFLGQAHFVNFVLLTALPVIVVIGRRWQQEGPPRLNHRPSSTV
ncbi:MAG: polyprenol phosphomannose-dependent alpha 1,6 mannosyltransferase MptB [Candidatus Melainabacteria bacterium]